MHSQTGFLPELAVKDRGNVCVGAVLGALADAAEHDLPLVPALNGLVKDNWRFRAGGSRGWRVLTLHLIADLETGQPLSAALARFAGRRLPAGFYESLRDAEAQDRVRVVLPVLVRCRNHVLFLGRVSWQGVFVYPLIQFCTAASVMAGLMIFIIPKFARIFEELSERPFQPPSLLWLTWVGRAVNTLFYWALPLLLIAFVIYILLVFLPHWPRLHAAWERALFALPIIGPQVRQLPLLELAYGMAVLTAANRDVVQAAEWSRRASRSPWMRARLAFFIERVTAGENWADAWEETRLGTPLHDWIVRSAAAREKPTEGFQLLLEWLSKDLGRRALRIAAWVEPALILLNACLIGSVVCSVFATLVALIYVTM